MPFAFVLQVTFWRCYDINMSKSKIKPICDRSKCPITNTLDLIGDKWTLIIIRDMVFLKKSQFGDFINSGEGISTNILTDRLKKLEQYGIIKKSTYQENPVRYEYHLTEIGESLQPLLMEFISWGTKHIEGVYVPTKEDLKKAMKKQIRG